MSLKSALITAATLGAIVCFAGQDPRLDYSFAAPDLDASAAPDITATVALAVPKTAVSVNFKNAKLSDVLSWASKRGVSFVVEDQDIQDRRITLSIVNQPLDKTMDAIANALDGRWERRGDILVFRKGFSFFTESVPAMRALPPITGGAGFATPGDRVEVRVEGQAIPALPNSPTAPAEIRVFGERMGEGKAFAFGFDEKAHKELAEKIAKEVQAAMRDAKMDDPKFWEQFGKELSEELQKSLPKGGFPGMMEFREMHGAHGMAPMKSMDRIKIVEKEARLAESKATRLKVVDGKKFLQSLTPAQKALQKSRGYLKMSDLTPAQREMLGVSGDGDFTFELKMNGETVKVKK